MLSENKEFNLLIKYGRRDIQWGKSEAWIKMFCWEGHEFMRSQEGRKVKKLKALM